MARPAEKARAMLNKWVAMREAGNDDGKKNTSFRGRKRPHLASECEHLADAEKYRGQIIREIANDIEKIQNPGLGENEIRELNDNINHRIREKYHWNKRIKDLGGPDYNSIERQRQIEEGNSANVNDAHFSSSSVAPSAGGGYRYFGMARELPGVKELLEREARTAERRKLQRLNVGDLYKNVTTDYFGFRDEEDGVLVEVEQRATKRNDEVAKKNRRLDTPELRNATTRDYLDVSSQEEVAQLLLQQKKKALIAKFSI